MKFRKWLIWNTGVKSVLYKLLSYLTDVIKLWDSLSKSAFFLKFLVCNRKVPFPLLGESMVVSSKLLPFFPFWEKQRNSIVFSEKKSIKLKEIKLTIYSYWWMLKKFSNSSKHGAEKWPNIYVCLKKV